MTHRIGLPGRQATEAPSQRETSPAAPDPTASAAPTEEHLERAPGPDAAAATVARRPWAPQWLETAYLVWLPWAAVLLGAALRIRNWLHERSLWLDELSVARNIVGRSFAQLTHPLGSNQAAPIGWLWAERLSIKIFGVNENALRLVPLLMSLVALAVFPLAARMLITRAAAPVATVLFATSPALIYFAAETKQYSADAAVVLLVLLVTAPLTRSAPTLLTATVWGLACSVLIWFSFPAVAVAGACGLVLLARWIRRPRVLAVLLGGGALLAVSAAVEYQVTLRKLAKNTTLTTYWQAVGGYPPRRAGLVPGLTWLHQSGFAVVRNPGHLVLPGLVLLVAGWGLVRTAVWRLDAAVLLCIPIALAVGLAATRHYPMYQRLAVFAVPSLLMLVAAGAVGVVTAGVSALHDVRPHWPVAWAGVALATALLVAVAGRTTVTGIGKFAHPDEVTNGREAVEYIADHKQPDDVILIEQPWAGPSFTFYGSPRGLHKHGGFHVVSRGCHPDPLAALRDRGRVWLLFAHLPGDEPKNRAQVYLSHFETEASLLQSYQGAGGAAAYLLDFDRPPAHAGKPMPLWRRSGCLVVSVPQ